MDLEIDEAKMLYGLGALLGVASIIYFGQELILDLSPTIKSFILLSSTGIFLAAGEYTRQGTIKSALYLFSAFSYLSFLGYIFLRFSFNSGETFLILAASSVVFLALGYLRSERYGLDRDQARKIIGVLGAAIALTIVFDALGPQPEYSLELREEVEVIEGEEFQVGTLEARNDFLLSRNLELPRFNGCVVTPEERRGLYINPDGDGLIQGRTTETYDLTERVNQRPDTNTTIDGNYTVRREECPSDPKEHTIYITEGENFEMLRSVD